jgi:hypothetical protein
VVLVGQQNLIATLQTSSLDRRRLAVSKKPSTYEPLARYVRVLADLLGLRDWEIVVATDFCDEDNLAETECTYGQRHAVLRFNKKWAEWSKEDLRSTVVHELLHVHTEPLTELLSDILQGVLSVKAASVATASMGYSLERIVDQIAVAIDPFFPEMDGSL